MRAPVICLSLLVLTLTLFSCTKTKSAAASTTDTASIIGTWTWAFQSRKLWFDQTSPNLTPASTSISRTLVFDTAGTFTFIHNDSIFVDTSNFNSEPNFLQVATPVQLLPDMQEETDTGSYQVSFGIVGCSFSDTTTLLMQNVPYQAILTTDTLMVFLDPCLSRTVDIYVRKN